MNQEIAFNLLVALAIGMIIGFEREWKAQIEQQETAYDAGFRTFTVVSFLGGLSAVLSETISPFILPSIALALSSIIFISYRYNAKRSKDFGYTSEVTLILVFAMGAFAAAGYTIEAIAFSAIVVALLRLKNKLHTYIKELEKEEVNATIQLLLLAAVALPLLPNSDIGPGGAINPRTIGIFILLIAGISYFGYFSTKLVGARLGIFLTALFGGLTSSTAVAVAFSKFASTNKNASTKLLGGGISLAAAMMGPRLLILVGIINLSLIPLVSPVLIALTVIPVIAAVWIAWHMQKKTKIIAPLDLKNPLQLDTAAFYGIIISLLFLVTYFVQNYYGAAGVYALAATSGLADADAISMTFAKSAEPVGNNLLPLIAANGILIAAFTNTLVKAIISLVIGGWELAKWSGSILIIAFLSGLLIHFVVYTP